MAVICGKCGEELLGAVNRCWKCGTEALSTPDSAQAPPVRRAPLVLPAAATAEQGGGQDEAANGDNGEPDEIVFAADFASPDGGATSDLPTAPPAARSAPVPAQRPTDHSDGWAPVAAYISLALGLAAVVFGIFFSPLLFFAVTGLAAGIWALRSRRKTVATWGLVCCCLGMAISGMRFAYDAFVLIYGDPPIQLVPDEPVDDFGLEGDPYGNDPYGNDDYDDGN